MIRVQFKRTGLPAHGVSFRRINKKDAGYFYKEFRNIVELINFIENNANKNYSIYCVDLKRDLTASQWQSYCYKVYGKNRKRLLEHPPRNFSREEIEESCKNTLKRMLS